jgi:hypothetical protein
MRLLLDVPALAIHHPALPPEDVTGWLAGLLGEEIVRTSEEETDLGWPMTVLHGASRVLACYRLLHLVAVAVVAREHAAALALARPDFSTEEPLTLAELWEPGVEPTP